MGLGGLEMFQPLQKIQKRKPKHPVEIGQPSQPETERNYGLRIVVALLAVIAMFALLLVGCSPSPEPEEINLGTITICDNTGQLEVCDFDLPPPEGFPLDPIDALVTEKIFESPDYYYLVVSFAYGTTPITSALSVTFTQYQTILLGDVVGVVCWQNYAVIPITNFSRCELEQ